MKKLIIYSLLMILPLGNIFATTIYVNENASGNNDGTSWANAYNILQDAITASVEGDEIWIAAGVYLPTIDATNGGSSPGDPAARHFRLEKNVKIYGGFVGDETSLTERDLENNLTILSGDLNGDDENLDGNFISEDYTQNQGLNTRRTMILKNVTEDLILDGLIFTGVDNSGNGYGSSIFLKNGNPIIKNCKFYGNESYRGGVIYAESEANNVIDPTIENCHFQGNKASDRGSTIYLIAYYSEAYATVRNCTFENNSSSLGTIFFHGGYPHSTILENCLFKNNISSDRGGALFLFSTGSHEITNCTFVDNYAASSGGAIRIESAGASTTITNSIFYNNTATSTQMLQDFGGANESLTINYSLLSEDQCPSNVNCQDGMIYGEDPLFVNAPDDLHLQENSPCVDAGSNTNTPSFDLDGNPRPFPGTTVDMGAYEFQVITSNENVLLQSQLLKVAVSPNPTSNQIRITINQEASNSEFQLTLFNSLGQPVIHQSLDGFMNQHFIDIKNQPAGSYWMEIKNKEYQSEIILVEKIN